MVRQKEEERRRSIRRKRKKQAASVPLFHLLRRYYVSRSSFRCSPCSVGNIFVFSIVLVVQKKQRKLERPIRRRFEPASSVDLFRRRGTLPAAALLTSSPFRFLPPPSSVKKKKKKKTDARGRDQARRVPPASRGTPWRGSLGGGAPGKEGGEEEASLFFFLSASSLLCLPRAHPSSPSPSLLFLPESTRSPCSPRPRSSSSTAVSAPPWASRRPSPCCLSRTGRLS